MLGESLFIPPRLVVRALEDLHTIAEAARRLPDIERALLDTERQLTGHVDRLDARLEEALETLTGATGKRGPLHRASKDLGRAVAQLDEILRRTEAIERGLPTIERTAESIDTLGVATATLAAAVEPLQGIVERLARVAERLPGGGRGRS